MGFEWRLCGENQIERLFWKVLESGWYGHTALDQRAELIGKTSQTAKSRRKRTLSVGAPAGTLHPPILGTV